MNNKDVFDEFEFKPITQGLGFHRNATPEVKAEPKFEMPKSKANFYDFDIPKMPKAAPAPMSEPSQSNSTVEAILKTLNDQRKYEIVNEKESLRQVSTAPKYVKSHWNFSAVLLDAMLVFSMNLICLIILLTVTKVDLFLNIFNPDSEGMVYLSLFGLFTSVTWIYSVSTRLFLGFTAGEWVFDQRLGRPEQFGTGLYSLKVAMRSVITIASGFILFPALSTLFNRDLLGQVMGLELVKKA